MAHHNPLGPILVHFCLPNPNLDFFLKKNTFNLFLGGGWHLVHFAQIPKRQKWWFSLSLDSVLDIG